MWFCYSFLRTEPEIPSLWISRSHKRMQQLIPNAPIDIIYHLSYLQYFDSLKIINVIPGNQYDTVNIYWLHLMAIWLCVYYIERSISSRLICIQGSKQLVRKKSFNNVVSNIISFTTKWVISNKLRYPNSCFILEKDDLAKQHSSSIAQVLIYCSWSFSGKIW